MESKTFITWQEYGKAELEFLEAIKETLRKQLFKYEIDLVLGIATGGIYPAISIAFNAYKIDG